MTDDLISRAMIVRVFRERSKSVVGWASKVYGEIAQEFEGWPAVDAVPVRHGKWVYHDDDVMPWNSCSLCGCSAFDLHGANYCPNCGARMDEEVSGNGQAQD